MPLLKKPGCRTGFTLPGGKLARTKIFLDNIINPIFVKMPSLMNKLEQEFENFQSVYGSHGPAQRGIHQDYKAEDSQEEADLPASQGTPNK